MGKWIERFKRLLFEENVYSIGIRRRTDKLLYEGSNGPFKVLPITKDEWYADPIVFRHNGKDYLFCEVYDRNDNIGRIGVTLLEGGMVKRPEICLDIDSHLSYPMVFEADGCVYMIPETTTRKNVMLFRAVDFPLKWEYAAELLSGDEYADTTVFGDDEKRYIFTYKQFEGNGSIVRIDTYDATDISDGCVRKIDVQSSGCFSDQLRGGGELIYT